MWLGSEEKKGGKNSGTQVQGREVGACGVKDRGRGLLCPSSSYARARMYTQRVACALPVLPRPQEKERLAKQQAGEEGEEGQGQGEGEKKPAGKKAKGPQYAGRKGGV